MSCNQTSAYDWFYLTSTDILDRNRSNCWPWPHVSSDTWIRIVDLLTLQNLSLKLGQLGMLTISPFGILGSLCIICALWQKAIVKKERFYIWMFAIAAIDLIVCSSYILDALRWGGFIENIYQYDPLVYQLAWYNYGLCCATASASDFCTLIVTVERFFAVSRPTQSLSKPKKIIATIFEIILIASVACSRFYRYGFEFEVSQIENSTSYTSVSRVVSQTGWFQALVLVQDFGICTIVLFFMIYFPVRIGLIVLKRRRTRIKDTASTQQQKIIEQQSSAMLRLLLILDSFYLCNQIAFWLYIFGLLLNSKIVQNVTFNATYSELISNANILLFLNFIGTVSTIVDVLFRSINFYVYFCFSITLRNEFKKVARQISSSFFENTIFTM